MPRAYPHRINQLFEVLNCKKPLKMSVKFDSTEHVLSSLGVGFTTDYKEKHYVIHPTSMGERVQLRDVLPLAYSGCAAVFGEPETACKGYAFAIEDYFSSVLRTRVLMIKEGENGLAGVIDDGWQELMAWRERPMDLAHATKRPPVNFQVNLRHVRAQVMDGTWPAARFDKNQPMGQFCALLFPPDRVDRDLWPVYTKARDALKAYRPESFMEEDGCCWNSLYRAGGEWCPPIEVAEGNFFFNNVKKNINKDKPVKKPQAKKVEPEKEKPAKPVETVESDDDEFTDASEEVPAPQEEDRAEEIEIEVIELEEENIEPPRPTGARPKTPAAAARSVQAKARNPQFTVGEDYAPGHDPINRKLEELGYHGAEKRNIYKMVRNGHIALEAVLPKQEKSTSKKNKPAGQPEGRREPPSRGASREPIGPPRRFVPEREYPAPRGDVIRFASFEGTRKLNALCQKGEFDRVESALKSPRDEWTVGIKVSVTDKITAIKRYIRKNPEGALQTILDLMRKLCKSEKSYMKVLGILYGIMDIDVEDNTYSARDKKDPLEDSDEE